MHAAILLTLFTSADSRSSGSKSLRRVSTSSSNTRFNSHPFSQTLIAKLKVMTSGNEPVFLFFQSSPSACCLCPDGIHVLIAELQLSTFGSKSLSIISTSRSNACCHLSPFFTSADSRSELMTSRIESLFRSSHKPSKGILPLSNLTHALIATFSADDVGQQIIVSHLNEQT